MTTFDDRDAAILADRIAARAKLSGPQVGDFVLMPDGELRRFTYRWPDGLQTTWCGEGGFFHFDRSGLLDYSGSLDSTIANERITDTGETRDGWAWFFHHDFATAHNGVDCIVPCRVWRVASGEVSAVKTTNEFSVGQRVRCIDARASFNRLAEGAIYTVAEAYPNNGGVVLAEIGDWRTWTIARFVAAELEG